MDTTGVQILDEAVFISRRANTFGARYESFYLPSYNG